MAYLELFLGSFSCDGSDASSDQVTHQWFDVLMRSYKYNELKFSNEVHHLLGINGIVNLMITKGSQCSGRCQRTGEHTLGIDVRGKNSKERKEKNTNVDAVLF